MTVVERGGPSPAAAAANGRQTYRGTIVASSSGKSRDVKVTSAGLVLMGEVASAGGLTPAQVWSHLARVDKVPTYVIDDGQDQHLQEVDRRWLKLAGAAGILGGDGLFLVSVAGVGEFSRGWARAALSGNLGLAENLCINSGEPEFVTAAVDGHAFCSVTTEENGVWVVVANMHDITR